MFERSTTANVKNVVSHRAPCLITIGQIIHRSCSIQLVVIVAACEMFIFCPTRAAGGVDQALVQMVSDAIQANYSHIRTADLNMRETSVDASVKEPSVQVLKMPSGGVARITRAPKVVRQTHVQLSGQSVRVDRSQVDKPVDRVQETLVRHDGVWTQLVPGHHAAWRRKPDQMPGMFPQDPRDYGAMEVQRSLPAILAEDQVLRAEMTDDPRGKLIAQIVTRNAKGAETVYEFSPTEGFLPVRLSTHWPDGSLLQVVEISYRTVLEGKARFPSKLVRTFFGKNVAHDFTDDRWRQQMRLDVMGEITLNESIPQSVFEPELPANTRVSDSVRQTIYETTKAPVSRGRIPAWYYTAAIVAVLLVIVITRRFLSSSRIPSS